MERKKKLMVYKILHRKQKKMSKTNPANNGVNFGDSEE